MSILIRGMEMPHQGEFSHVRIYDNGEVTVAVDTGKDVYEAVIANAVSVPPHGRLIDADALSEKMVICSKHIPKDSFEWDLCGEVITQVALAPTIIEAKGRETDEDQT